jgi:hypothetical protein
VPPSACVRQVACGYSHTAVLTHEGEVWSWGSNKGGGCGHDVSRGFVIAPHRIDCVYIAPYNLSKGRPSRQSSTYAKKFSFLAVNGDASGASEEVCTHTQFDHEPWWEVSLSGGAVPQSPQRVAAICLSFPPLLQSRGVGGWCGASWCPVPPFPQVDLGCVCTLDRIVVNSRRASAGTDFPQRICPFFILGAVRPFDGLTGQGRCALPARLPTVLAWARPPFLVGGEHGDACAHVMRALVRCDSLQRSLGNAGFKALITRGKRVLVWNAPPGTKARYVR